LIWGAGDNTIFGCARAIEKNETYKD
jgi:hypothetical protein